MTEKLDSQIKGYQKQYDMLVRCSKKSDFTEWNTWRENNPDETINLTGADFTGLNFAKYIPPDKRPNLQGAVFFSAYFEGACLNGVNLTGANLCSGHLKGAKLAKVILQKAILTDADLRGANLFGAQLQGTEIDEARLHDACLITAKLDDARLYSAKLPNADFSNAQLKKATFEGADLQGATFKGANLQSTRLHNANLQEAKFHEADCQGTWFNEAQLQGTQFNLARVDGLTTIDGCQFDQDTDFTGVGLDGATIDPGLKTALKDNIRRIHWKKWFNKGNWLAKAVKNVFVRPFWWMTGYGSSTAAILYWFWGIALIFGALYFSLEHHGSGIIDGLHPDGKDMGSGLVFFRAFYFSVVTMTTLGFGDLAAKDTSHWGHILLMVQVIIGYVMLGALATRLGILFTNDAPAARPTPAAKKVQNR